jgi:hypothetical protein
MKKLLTLMLLTTAFYHQTTHAEGIKAKLQRGWNKFMNYGKVNPTTHEPPILVNPSHNLETLRHDATHGISEQPQNTLGKAIHNSHNNKLPNGTKPHQQAYDNNPLIRSIVLPLKGASRTYEAERTARFSKPVATTNAVGRVLASPVLSSVNAGKNVYHKVAGDQSPSVYRKAAAATAGTAHALVSHPVITAAQLTANGLQLAGKGIRAGVRAGVNKIKQYREYKARNATLE